MADSVIADGGAMATDAADYPAPATAITAPSTVESKAGNRQRMRSEMATSSPLESPAQAMPAAKEQSQAQAQASEPQAPPQPRRSTRASNTAAAAAAASSKALRSGGAHDRSDSDEDILLPHTTTLLLTTVPPPLVTLFESPELPISLQATIEVPECKMLTDSDLPIGRLRLLPGQQSDFSDEYYQRKHLPGEVLERKSNKQERDRLVQERNRLRYQVENLKAEVASAAFYANASPIRGSSAAAGSAPSSSANNNATGVTAHAERIKETERIKRKQLQELMDTLRRYEELLEPREPCNTGSTTGTPASAVAGAAGAAGRMWTTGGKGIPPAPTGVTPHEFLNDATNGQEPHDPLASSMSAAQRKLAAARAASEAPQASTSHGKAPSSQQGPSSSASTSVAAAPATSSSTSGASTAKVSGTRISIKPLRLPGIEQRPATASPSSAARSSIIHSVSSAPLPLLAPKPPALAQQQQQQQQQQAGSGDVNLDAALYNQQWQQQNAQFFQQYYGPMQAAAAGYMQDPNQISSMVPQKRPRGRPKRLNPLPVHGTDSPIDNMYRNMMLMTMNPALATAPLPGQGLSSPGGDSSSVASPKRRYRKRRTTKRGHTSDEDDGAKEAEEMMNASREFLDEEYPPVAPTDPEGFEDGYSYFGGYADSDASRRLGTEAPGTFASEADDGDSDDAKPMPSKNRPRHRKIPAWLGSGMVRKAGARVDSGLRVPEGVDVSGAASTAGVGGRQRSGSSKPMTKEERESYWDYRGPPTIKDSFFRTAAAAHAAAVADAAIAPTPSQSSSALAASTSGIPDATNLAGSSGAPMPVAQGFTSHAFGHKIPESLVGQQQDFSVAPVLTEQERMAKGIEPSTPLQSSKGMEIDQRLEKVPLSAPLPSSRRTYGASSTTRPTPPPATALPKILIERAPAGSSAGGRFVGSGNQQQQHQRATTPASGAGLSSLTTGRPSRLPSTRASTPSGNLSSGGGGYSARDKNRRPPRLFRSTGVSGSSNRGPLNSIGNNGAGQNLQRKALLTATTTAAAAAAAAAKTTNSNITANPFSSDGELSSVSSDHSDSETAQDSDAKFRNERATRLLDAKESTYPAFLALLASTPAAAATAGTASGPPSSAGLLLGGAGSGSASSVRTPGAETGGIVTAPARANGYFDSLMNNNSNNSTTPLTPNSSNGRRSTAAAATAAAAAAAVQNRFNPSRTATPEPALDFSTEISIVNGMRVRKRVKLEDYPTNELLDIDDSQREDLRRSYFQLSSSRKGDVLGRDWKALPLGEWQVKMDESHIRHQIE